MKILFKSDEKARSYECFKIKQGTWEILMSLNNLIVFYPIWVGFSLKIIILIGEHCYKDFNVKNKISNFGAKFKLCL